MAGLSPPFPAKTANLIRKGADPTENDDSSAGYREGFFWFNTLTGEVFQAASVAAGEAVWREVLKLDEEGNLEAVVVPRSDTASNLDLLVLSEGELAIATDTRDLRLGDGETPGGNSLTTNNLSNFALHFHSGYSGEIAYDEAFNINEWTLEIWYRSAAKPNSGFLVERLDRDDTPESASTWGFRLRPLGADARLELQIGTSSSTPTLNGLFDQEWNHLELSMSYAAAQATWRAFLNGQNVYSNTIASPVPANNQGFKFASTTGSTINNSFDIARIRYSSVVRHTSNFDPEYDLEHDENTVFYFAIQEARGNPQDVIADYELVLPQEIRNQRVWGYGLPYRTDDLTRIYSLTENAILDPGGNPRIKLQNYPQPTLLTPPLGITDFEGIEWLKFMSDDEDNYPGAVSGDPNFVDKITAQDGVDPPYVLYDLNTRDNIRKQAASLPEAKKSGAMVYFDSDLKKLVSYVPAEDMFYDLLGTQL